MMILRDGSVVTRYDLTLKHTDYCVTTNRPVTPEGREEFIGRLVDAGELIILPDPSDA